MNRVLQNRNGTDYAIFTATDFLPKEDSSVINYIRQWQDFAVVKKAFMTTHSLANNTCGWQEFLQLLTLSSLITCYAQKSILHLSTQSLHNAQRLLTGALLSTIYKICNEIALACHKLYWLTVEGGPLATLKYTIDVDTLKIYVYIPKRWIFYASVTYFRILWRHTSFCVCPVRAVALGKKTDRQTRPNV